MGVAARRAAEFCEEEMRDEVRRAFDLGNKIGFLTGRGAALLSLVDPLEQHAARTQALARVNRASVTKKRSTLGTDYVSSPVTEEDRARIEVLDRQLGSEFSKPYARAREIAARLGIKQRRVEYVMGLRRKK